MEGEQCLSGEKGWSREGLLKQTSVRIRPRGRTQEIDLFQRPGVKAVKAFKAVTYTTGTAEKSNSLWPFNLTLSFFGVIKIFSVLSFKTELPQWIDTENMGTALPSLFLLWSLC